MEQGYEINELAKEESWRMFRIIGELVEGFDKLSGIEPAITIYGSARVRPGDELYAKTTLEIRNRRQDFRRAQLGCHGYRSRER